MVSNLWCTYCKQTQKERDWMWRWYLLTCICYEEAHGNTHPTLQTSKIVSALNFLSLQTGSITINGIGSHGASIISNCLATNPGINMLVLDGNLFNDVDAKLFANSLKSIRNLLRLNLRGNNFIDAGTRTLFKYIFDDQSLNTIHDSNNTCKLELFTNGRPTYHTPIWIDKAVLSMNMVIILL